MPHEEFVAAWLDVYEIQGSIEDVAKKVGISKKHAYSRADRLRRMGVKLPSFRDRQIVTDEHIDDLNDIIKKRQRES